MNVVLVCLHNFQDYILTNIDQLLFLQHSNIYVLTNQALFPHFENVKGKIRLINVDELHDSYGYLSKTTLNRTFRNGFWALASLRLFYLYEFMKKYQVENVIHLENDVMIYYHCDCLQPILDPQYIYLPFDTFQRNIVSIMYVPSHEIYKKALDLYDFRRNDMDNFSLIQQKTKLIQNFPIFPTSTINDEFRFVTQNYPQFQCIFDAAAMGQYLGGVDPRNQAGNTEGFVNETCVVKYDQYQFTWMTGADHVKRPFLKVRGEVIPIFNLHIHCKNLKKFLSYDS